ncbi:PREDICTED: probable E3 ubiquitin-protein ligase ARI16 [Camelina sativa]|uniref:RBR-type E3 ubiquitin transferase n=1 Tax=Camelina sativa TaxID=90675 RepID=A0ABM0V9D2_CAMSA|nr:PREDICTED: probable E3 ubiquitin-protein ligase ARI16 [Camelina sativa]
MEAAGQKYSVLVKTEVRDKMMGEINQISEFFSVSKSDATVILVRLRWNSFKASDLLVDNKDKFLAELGLARVPISNSSSAGRETTTLPDGDGDYLVSTPFCSHKFSTTCWSEYLNDALVKNKEETGLIISCLNQGCVASVGPDTIDKLTDRVKEMYEGWLLESFMECHKATIQWCPASDCKYAILLEDDTDEVDFGVVCLCGHTFCWTCGLESHRPVDCKKASIWSTDLLDQLRTVSWIHANTKRCPNCNIPVQQNEDPDYKLMECICSYSFCWVCLRTAQEHNGNWNCVPVAGPVGESSSRELTQIFRLDLWEARQKEMEKAKSNQKLVEEKFIPSLEERCGVSELDIRTIKEAEMLIVQCRQVLKWSCVFEYYMTEEYGSTKMQYLQHRRDLASVMVWNHEITRRWVIYNALDERNFTCVKHKMETSTTNTGNYFHGFVKNLEEGMPEVLYGDRPIIRWLCHKCFFSNKYVDKECQLCYVPRESPESSHVAAPDDLLSQQ